jgi:hypothetical protein
VASKAGDNGSPANDCPAVLAAGGEEGWIFGLICNYPCKSPVLLAIFCMAKEFGIAAVKIIKRVSDEYEEAVMKFLFILLFASALFFTVVLMMLINIVLAEVDAFIYNHRHKNY